MFRPISAHHKMTYAFVIITYLFIIIPHHGLSQTVSEGDSITIDQLKTPASPGFVLLGVEPTSVERPSTPKAVALSLISATNDSTLIPQNYALEIAPYWLLSHPELSFRDYYNPSLGQTILQNLSLSLASTKASNLDTASIGTSVGFGIRTLLLAGRPSANLEAKVLLLQEKQARLNLVLHIEDIKAPNIDTLKIKVKAALTDLIDAVRANPDRWASKIPENKRVTVLENAVKAIMRHLEKEKANTAAEVDTVLMETIAAFKDLRKIALEFQAENKKRVGLLMELAGAVALNFPENNYGKREVIQWGFWLTPAYRFEKAFESQKSFLDIIGVGRFIREQKRDDTIFDVGARLLYQHDQVHVSVEFVRRLKDKESDSNRLVGMVDFRLNDDLYLNASFGKNYDAAVGSGGNLVSHLGINFGFGKNPITKLE